MHEPNLLVVAPPGCGKTEFLALRAEALLSRLKPNQKILALTFTNRSKANLSERLRRHLGLQRFRRYVSVRNFHGHGAEVVLSHGRTLGIPVERLKMPTMRTLRRALAQFSSDRGANDAAAKLLGTIKRDPLSDEEVVAALEAAGDQLAQRVEVERVNEDQLHYEDLLRHAQRLLSVEEIANLYHQHYGAVLVDEFQDLSLQQLDLVMRSCSSSRTFAGDPLQGIYSWAGAAPKEVQSQLRGCCGEPIQLTVSYRSSPAVLAMLNAVFASMRAKPLQAYNPGAWPEGGASAAILVKSQTDEARFISLASKRIVEADLSASVGIITRSGWRRVEIDKAFATMSGVSCRRWDLAIEDPAIVERLRSAVIGMPQDVSFETARARVIAGIDPSDVDTIEQIEDAFEHLGSESAGGVRAALRNLYVRNDDSPVSPGIHLLNAHTGKGQQFDWVFIPGLEEGHLPDRRSSSGEALAEEQRVLLVMLSRARHAVVCTSSASLDGRYGQYDPRRSRWWADLVAAATMDLAGVTAHINRLYPKVGVP